MLQWVGRISSGCDISYILHDSFAFLLKHYTSLIEPRDTLPIHFFDLPGHELQC